MDAQKVDMFLITHSKHFEGRDMQTIRERLSALDDSRFGQLLALNLKDPNTMITVSMLGGQLGIDRFMIGETGLGIAKLLTCGGFGIWAIVDWFLIAERTRQLNGERLLNLLV